MCTLSSEDFYHQAGSTTVNTTAATTIYIKLKKGVFMKPQTHIRVDADGRNDAANDLMVRRLSMVV